MINKQSKVCAETTRTTYRDQVSKILLSSVEQRADKELLKQFVHIYFAYIPNDDLLQKSPQDWSSTILAHWELLAAQSAGECLVETTCIDPVDGIPYTQIMVVADDQPFLVDSLSMELVRLQLNVSLLLNTSGFELWRESGAMQLAPYQPGRVLEHAKAALLLEVNVRLSDEQQETLKNNFTRILGDVSAATADWPAMKSELRKVIMALDNRQKDSPQLLFEEEKIFLSWMLKDNFVFLGCRFYDVINDGKELALSANKDTGLGVLRASLSQSNVRYVQDMAARARDYLLNDDNQLIIAKSNMIATMHRRVYTDMIGVKIRNDQGDLIGEMRFIGMFTSHAYAQSPREVPLLRKKVEKICERTNYPKQGYLWKDLIHIISTLPRDDLFHATVDELYQWSVGILRIQDRYRTKLFIRQDAFDRSYSCLLFLPRDNFNSSIVTQCEHLLASRMQAISIEHSTQLFGTSLARIHFDIRVDRKNAPEVDVVALERDVIDLCSSWQDHLKSLLFEKWSPSEAEQLSRKYLTAFSKVYREHYSPQEAFRDIEFIDRCVSLQAQQSVLISCDDMGTCNKCRFKLYSLSESAKLSDILPVLENMGLMVLDEFPAQVTMKDGVVVWINDFLLQSDKVTICKIMPHAQSFEETFCQVVSGKLANDPLNTLVASAGLNWNQIRMLRSYIRYAKQIGTMFSESYIAAILLKYPSVVENLVLLFENRFNPELTDNRDERQQHCLQLIVKELEQISVLDDDRLIRMLQGLILATLRTNYYRKCDDRVSEFLSIKIDPNAIPNFSSSKTKIETFVHAVDFEGIHLRAEKVARGGIRWSSRIEDYRTEVLGLVSAQYVKNAVIVPAGAKGGFVLHAPESSFTTEELWKEGKRCYASFIQGILDVIDDRIDGVVQHHPDVVYYDGDDPLAVVAADRRTASFSDLANAQALERQYWLGDGFASGGSNGYDHKKMGITAKGAWVSARRSFQEMGRHLDSENITVVGIGDMSGDVFGNGMLLSPNLKLLAAFNHKHIFLDPNPCPRTSFEERSRLFALARSGWNDYDPKLISKGGGVFERTLKSIPLSPEIQALLGTHESEMEPFALIRALLMSKVDMLWNGGIGTYVKSSHETHQDVSDKANDGLRVNGNEVGALVVCEGGNLGLTQKGRIEYAEQGGCVFTDFIDNSAGVDCSDHEVNIKIFLNELVASGEMSLNDRNKLLEEMSDEVSELVLRNNYLQTQSVVLMQRLSAKKYAPFHRLQESLADQGYYNEHDESLPSEKTLLARQAKGYGYTSPEMSTLYAYTKIALVEGLREHDLLGDEELLEYLYASFPDVMCQMYGERLKNHYLANEIIATQLVNAVVSDMGILFLNHLMHETSASLLSVMRAYVVASRLFDLRSYLGAINELDHKLSPDMQSEVRLYVVALMRRVVRWLLRNTSQGDDISQLVAGFAEPMGVINEHYSDIVTGKMDDARQLHQQTLVEKGVPDDLAIRLSKAHLIYHAMNVSHVAIRCDMPVLALAKSYFKVSHCLRLFWFREKIDDANFESDWALLARSACKADLDQLQQQLAVKFLNNVGEADLTTQAIDLWLATRQAAVDRWHSIVASLQGTMPGDSAIIFVAMRYLKEVSGAD